MKPSKKIEDMDFYEILGLSREASPAEIEAAHRASVSIYEPESLASYGLVTDEERRFMLERIDQAYRTLADPVTRRLYDDENFPAGTMPSPRALFRKSVNRVEIQDGDDETGFLARVRRLLQSKKDGDRF